MKYYTKQIWYFTKCEIPELMANWRIIPRLLMALYTYAFYSVTTWFMAMPDPTTAQTGFVATVVGAGAGFFGLYVGSGNTTNRNHKNIER
jgi:hypothetical protein